MKPILLSECLNKLDNIIYMKYIDYDDDIDIRSILNYIRIFLEEHKKKRDYHNFFIILKYLNYIIQESIDSITFNFITHIIILRLLIIKFEDNTLQIYDDEIDFNKNPKLLIKYVRDKDNDYEEIIINDDNE